MRYIEYLYWDDTIKVVMDWRKVDYYWVPLESSSSNKLIGDTFCHAVYSSSNDDPALFIDVRLEH